MSAACATPSLSPLSLLGPVATHSATARQDTWQLGAGQAITLKATAATVLQIRQGRVWVTRDATPHWGSEDVVLTRGESMLLEAGQRVVMEPWDGYGATYTWEPSTALAA